MGSLTMKFRIYIVVSCLCFFLFSLESNRLSAQAPADSSAKKDTVISSTPSPDTTNKTSAVRQNKTDSVAKSVPHSVVVMEFVKEKSEYSPDSTYCNILKITNNNGKLIQGLVSISVPQGWKLISPPQTLVSVSPGNTEYVPIRASLARSVIRGVSYLITATLNSNRSLVPNKNQTSVSKTCYVTIPQKRSWDVYAVQRSV